MSNKRDATMARRLEEMAAQCRHVAQQRSDGISMELEKLARDYDNDAAKITSPVQHSANPIIAMILKGWGSINYKKTTSKE